MSIKLELPPHVLYKRKRIESCPWGFTGCTTLTLQRDSAPFYHPSDHKHRGDFNSSRTDRLVSGCTLGAQEKIRHRRTRVTKVELLYFVYVCLSSLFMFSVFRVPYVMRINCLFNLSNTSWPDQLRTALQSINVVLPLLICDHLETYYCFCLVLFYFVLFFFLSVYVTDR